MSAENHAAVRRAYVDLLYATGQLPGIEHLFAVRETGFEPISLEDDDAVGRRVEEALQTLTNAGRVIAAEEFAVHRPSEEGPSSPPLSPSDWLRAFATLAHHREWSGSDLDGERIEIFDRVTRNSPPEFEPDAAQALEIVRSHVQELGTLDLERVVANMTQAEHQQFVRAVGHHVVHSVTRGCDVESISMSDGGGRAIRIEASYVSEDPPSKFVYPADPRNWPKCNAFFKQMLPTEKEIVLQAPGLDDPDHRGYRAPMTETVDFGYMEVTTHLNVVYYIRTTDAQAVLATGMSFDRDTAHPNDVIDVDYGYLSVESADGGSLVKSSKTLRFSVRAGEGGQWATIGGDWACRLGWLDTMEQMNSCSPN